MNPQRSGDGNVRCAGGNAYFFSSYHEGGVFFTFADGSAKFLSENIDMSVYRALSTIDNNEIVDDEDYWLWHMEDAEEAHEEYYQYRDRYSPFDWEDTNVFRNYIGPATNWGEDDE